MPARTVEVTLAVDPIYRGEQNALVCIVANFIRERAAERIQATVSFLAFSGIGADPSVLPNAANVCLSAPEQGPPADLDGIAAALAERIKQRFHASVTCIPVTTLDDDADGVIYQ